MTDKGRTTLARSNWPSEEGSWMRTLVSMTKVLTARGPAGASRRTMSDCAWTLTGMAMLDGPPLFPNVYERLGAVVVPAQRTKPEVVFDGAQQAEVRVRLLRFV